MTHILALLAFVALGFLAFRKWRGRYQQALALRAELNQTISLQNEQLAQAAVSIGDLKNQLALMQSVVVNVAPSDADGRPVIDSSGSFGAGVPGALAPGHGGWVLSESDPISAGLDGIRHGVVAPRAPESGVLDVRHSRSDGGPGDTGRLGEEVG